MRAARPRPLLRCPGHPPAGPRPPPCRPTPTPQLAHAHSPATHALINGNSVFPGVAPHLLCGWDSQMTASVLSHSNTDVHTNFKIHETWFRQYVGAPRRAQAAPSPRPPCSLHAHRSACRPRAGLLTQGGVPAGRASPSPPRQSWRVTGPARLSP